MTNPLSRQGLFTANEWVPTQWTDPELQAAQERGNAMFPHPCEVEGCDRPATPCQCGAAHCADHPHIDEVRRERNGFPIESCGRCGGSGHYSYNTMHGTVCYGCSGSGVRIARGAVKHHAAWRDAVRAAVRVITQDLQPGDRVRPWGDRDPAAERTVATIERTTERCGWSTAPDGTETTTAVYVMLRFEGEDAPLRRGGNALWHRLGVRIDPAPYVERADRGVAWVRRNQ